MNDNNLWRANKSQRAIALANDITVLAARARASGLPVVAYILDLAAQEAFKDAEKAAP